MNAHTIEKKYLKFLKKNSFPACQEIEIYLYFTNKKRKNFQRTNFTRLQLHESGKQVRTKIALRCLASKYLFEHLLSVLKFSRVHETLKLEFCEDGSSGINFFCSVCLAKFTLIKHVNTDTDSFAIFRFLSSLKIIWPEMNFHKYSKAFVSNNRHESTSLTSINTSAYGCPLSHIPKTLISMKKHDQASYPRFKILVKTKKNWRLKLK